ncbi:hypothetical protein GCM10009620_16970 [Microbacterium thalassium]
MTPMFRAPGSTIFSATKRGLGSALEPMGWRPMCSTPPAMARSYMPMAMEPAIVVTLVMAPAHMRSIAKPGTVSGSPARMPTVRPRVRPWSPVWLVAAIATSSMRSLGTSGLRSIRPIVAFTARSSDRVFQYMPFSPARPNGVRIPSTK